MKQLLAFILLSSLICWLMFAPVYRHVLIMRQAALQQEVDYLLEVGANGSHGYIDSSMVTASRERLRMKGFETTKLEYVISSESGIPANTATSPLMRGTGLELAIRYPVDRLFVIDRLIGLTPPDDSARIQASGIKMSEYVP